MSDDVNATYQDHRGYVATMQDGTTIVSLSLAGQRGWCWTSARGKSATSAPAAGTAARASGAGDELTTLAAGIGA
jgi:hypothetical protein